MLSLDPHRARCELQWSPRLTPKLAVRETLEWYARFLDGVDPCALCRRQIEEHSRAVVAAG
jgi:hypothetical protein